MTWSVGEPRSLDATAPRYGEVVYAFVGLDGAPYPAEEDLLDAEEKDRAARFVRAADSRRFIRAHAALRVFLARSLGLDPRDVRYETTEHGKPRLAAGLAASGLEFNLSHSHEIAVVAATRAGVLGVDVERERELPDAMDIAQKYFSPDERRDLSRLPSAERQGAFFRCWTRKEAVVKADGQGLGLPLDSFDVDLAPGSLSALRGFRHRAMGEGQWSLRDLSAPAGYAAAGAIRTPVSRHTRWRESEVT
jgi:4'-phosphopantetheinyl transferase